MPPVRLPNEIISTIFGFVDESRTLVTLAQCCTVFFAESYAWLYRHSLLHDLPSVIKWCAAIIRHPCAARAVRSLSIRISTRQYIYHNPSLSTSFWRVVARSIRLLINLATMDVSSLGHGKMGMPAWFFHACGTKDTLRHITTPNTLSPHFLAFLARHPSITAWSQGPWDIAKPAATALTQLISEPSTLPHLAYVSGPDSVVCKIVPGRPVTHVSVSTSNLEDFVHGQLLSLAQSSAVVKKLDLQAKHGDFTAEHLTAISRYLPQLETLRVQSRESPASYLTEWVSSLGSFTALTRIRVAGCSGDSIDGVLLAQAIHAHCRTIRIVILETTTSPAFLVHEKARTDLKTFAWSPQTCQWLPRLATVTTR
ncbi:hypothetical protein BOTBODRAFT_191379 [Botryobasidium botryosum FD-172 SS1]|uniref:F-box domain-containing protein n=1 Tax=Botryobasidium botryosum (strain FD-172 SS1) TaxID=930990 RepID=A0A067MBT2_BOTB1|nr:hypothetical protein BOTBODRAFT_191379 [Botryobasidium botryosum FD-172 SS1]